MHTFRLKAHEIRNGPTAPVGICSLAHWPSGKIRVNSACKPLLQQGKVQLTDRNFTVFLSRLPTNTKTETDTTSDDSTGLAFK